MALERGGQAPALPQLPAQQLPARLCGWGGPCSAVGVRDPEVAQSPPPPPEGPHAPLQPWRAPPLPASVSKGDTPTSLLPGVQAPLQEP